MIYKIRITCQRSSISFHINTKQLYKKYFLKQITNSVRRERQSLRLTLYFYQEQKPNPAQQANHLNTTHDGIKCPIVRSSVG